MSNLAIFYVYILFRPWDGSPCYIGKGKGRRWLFHERNPDNHRNRNLARIIKKAKKLNLDIPKIKIRENLLEAEALSIEIAFIKAIGKKANGGPLVNLTDGGDGTSGLTPSKKTRAKMSAAKKGKPQKAEHVQTRANSNRGGKRTPEQRQRMGRAQRGHKRLQGRTIPTAVRAKISAKMMGNQNCLGVVHTTESRANMSEGQRRRAPPTEKTRAKMSQTTTRKWADPEHRAMMVGKMIAVASIPESRLENSKRIRALWADPDYRTRMTAAIRKGKEIKKAGKSPPHSQHRRSRRRRTLAGPGQLDLFGV
jgi:hypothetical protein